LAAEVAKTITFARRKNADWYVGSVTNHDARDLTVNLDFLSEGNYEAEIYTDSPEVGTNPNLLVKQIKEVTRKDKITLHLASGGGEVMHIRKK